jgi:hypothetical protein
MILFAVDEQRQYRYMFPKEYRHTGSPVSPRQLCQVNWDFLRVIFFVFLHRFRHPRPVKTGIISSLLICAWNFVGFHAATSMAQFHPWVCFAFWTFNMSPPHLITFTSTHLNPAHVRKHMMRIVAGFRDATRQLSRRGYWVSCCGVSMDGDLPVFRM